MDGYFTKGISNLFTDLGKYLSSLGFANGNVNDKALAFLKDRTGDTGSINNLSYDFMVNEGIPAGNIQDMFSKWLSLKVTTGSNAINDKIRRLNALPIPLLFMPLIDDLSLALGSGSATLTRSTTGTFIDKDDVLLKTAAIDIARFEADGVLIEGPSTNVLIRSEQIDNATWIKVFLSIMQDATIAPDGTTTADKLVEDSTNDTRRIRQPTATITGAGTISAYGKSSGESRFLQIRPEGIGSGKAFANFDLDLGLIGTSSGTSITSSSITPLANGWFRCSISLDDAGTYSPEYYMVTSATSVEREIYLGDGSSGFFLWGAQIEALPFASSYIKSVIASTTRTADKLSIGSNGNFNEPTGSISFTFDIIGDANTDQHFCSVNDGTDDNRHILLRSSDKIRTVVISSSVSQADYSDTSVFPVNETIKLAYTYSTNAFETFRDGVSIGSDTSGTPPTGVTSISLGSNRTGIQQLFGHIKSFRIDDVELTAEQVEVL